MFLKIASNFFAHYKDLSKKQVKVFDWHEKDHAQKIINEGKLSKFNFDTFTNEKTF